MTLERGTLRGQSEIGQGASGSPPSRTRPLQNEPAPLVRSRHPELVHEHVETTQRRGQMTTIERVTLTDLSLP